MSNLEMPDTHYLAAAIGWIELGNAAEAAAELERISPGLRIHPEVLEVRWIIAAERKDWPEGLKAAQSLVEHAPDRPTGWLHRAYALRRVPEGGLKPAWDALLPASDKFPKEPIIPYNLSCYACQMQLLEDARIWFKRAVDAGGKEKIKKMALADEDLKPLWGEINEM
jgi:tetratricopeptide (TPR) repeat protein